MIPDYADIPLSSTWPHEVIVACYKYNEQRMIHAQFESNGPDLQIVILKFFADDGRVNDYTCAERQARYRARLTPDGEAHELKLLNPIDTPWGIVREMDGLPLEVLTHQREHTERKVEWSFNTDTFSGMFVTDLAHTTHRIVCREENQQAYRDIKPSPQRKALVLNLCLKHYTEALIETGARMEAILTDAYQQGGTLEQVWARVV